MFCCQNYFTTKLVVYIFTYEMWFSKGNYRWWFQIFSIFIPYLRKWSNLTCAYVSNWVGSTTSTRGSVPKMVAPPLLDPTTAESLRPWGDCGLCLRYARSRFEERTNERDTFDATVLMERFGQVPGGGPGVLGKPQDGKGKSCKLMKKTCKLSNGYYFLRDC